MLVEETFQLPTHTRHLMTSQLFTQATTSTQVVKIGGQTDRTTLVREQSQQSKLV
jgi:hypothetical protein